MTQGLEEVVFQSGAFREVLDAVRVSTLKQEFPAVAWTAEVSDIDWGFAMLAASALTSTGSERSQAAVLRIATACILSDNVETGYKEAAAALLERAGNHMAVGLAEKRELLAGSAWTRTPPVVRLDVVRSRIAHSIRLADKELLSVNPFQSQFWEQFDAADWLSVSAPTSAGKSRIVRERFIDWARKHSSFTLVYLVPTRALIEEVSRDFRNEAPKGVGVFTLPWDPDFDKSDRRILVLTQERLHLVQELHSPFHIEVMFVDEAQSLGGNDRGVLLQRTIERAVRENLTMRVVFASPLSSNPQLLLDAAPTQLEVRAFTSETVTVNQNVIRVEGVRGKPKLRAVKLVTDGVPTDVGTLELQERATTVPLRLGLVTHALAGDSSGNVVYVNGPSEAEAVSKVLFEQLEAEAEDDDIKNLQDLVRTAVHPKYMLADVLARRVAFHYGNMPLVVRTEIERLFAAGKIKYLVCTSTLLEGVNLPCRSIFMRNPKKGRSRPLSEADFWNLAGRAGRWGKEFQGNVVCIDTDNQDLWENLPAARKRFPLTRAVDKGLSDPSGLLTFIRSGQVISDPRAESLFSYLCERKVKSLEIDALLETVAIDSERDEIESAVTTTLERSSFPLELVTRHSGISPSYMQRLLESFRASGEEPSRLELPLPEEPDARERFQAALVRVGATMTTVFGVSRTEDRRKHQIANLIVNWMNGMPLSRLIDQRLGQRQNAAQAIREVMTDIETVVRFQAPRYFACYSDILAVYAAERGVHAAAERVDYAMLLELGVSRPSEVVLMSLGLSRTATVSISSYVVRESWSSSEAIEWLQAQNIDSFDIPVLVQREIREVLASVVRRAAED